MTVIALSKLKMLPKKDFETLPLTQGVYFLFDKNKKLRYIGKTKILRSRMRNYFGNSGFFYNFIRGRVNGEIITHIGVWLGADRKDEIDCIKFYTPPWNGSHNDPKKIDYTSTKKECAMCAEELLFGEQCPNEKRHQEAIIDRFIQSEPKNISTNAFIRGEKTED